MSEVEPWRIKALTLFPDLAEDLAEDDSNTYTVFFELWPRCIRAHEAGDEDELKKIYDFADWCLHQEAEELRNVAGVCFYEHLVDRDVTRRQIPVRLTPELFDDLAGLFEYRMNPDEYAVLVREFKAAHGR